MAVRIVNLEQVPKRKRLVIPRIMKTIDWKIALSKMAEGLKPQQAILIVLSPEEMAEYKIKNIRAAARPIKKHVKTYGLPYTVTAKYTSEGGTIIIANQPVIAAERPRSPRDTKVTLTPTRRSKAARAGGKGR